MTTAASVTTTPAPDLALEAAVAELIVRGLNLDVKAADIPATAPLYGDGLGLDSIDMLEIALVISKEYGLQIRADSPDNLAIFGSLRSLAAHIAKNRAP